MYVLRGVAVKRKAISKLDRERLKVFLADDADRRCLAKGIRTSQVRKVLRPGCPAGEFYAVYDKLFNEPEPQPDSVVSPAPDPVPPPVVQAVAPVPETPMIHSKPQSARSSSSSRSSKVRYNLLIDQPLLDDLKARAEVEDRSVSSLIRVAVKDYLDRKR